MKGLTAEIYSISDISVILETKNLLRRRASASFREEGSTNLICVCHNLISVYTYSDILPSSTALLHLR